MTPIADKLRKFLPQKMAYRLTRLKNTTMQQIVYKKTRTEPEKVKEQLLGLVRAELGPDYDVDTHFTPSYNPWDQRLCLVPNSDLFTSIRIWKSLCRDGSDYDIYSNRSRTCVGSAS